MSLSPKIRFEVFKRDDFTCQYCGRKTPEVILEVDHIHPRCEGGSDEIENLATSCFECNRGKSGTPLKDIMQHKDVHEEAILLAEREMQLREYTSIKERVRKREDDEIKIIVDRFCKEFGEYPQNLCTTMIRYAMKKISYIDILEMLDYAIIKAGHDWKDGPGSGASKYLNSMIKNKLGEK